MSKINITRDVSQFAVAESCDPKSKLVLGLDLATTTGYAMAYFKPSSDPVKAIKPEFLGQWDLSAGPYDSGAIRFARLRQFLELLKPQAIFYEDVKNASGKANRAGVELIGAFRAMVCTWAEENSVPCTGFPIGTIKRRATGDGAAGKEEVIKACNALFQTEFDPDSYTRTGVDNVADAAFVLLLGLEQYGKGL